MSDKSYHTDLGLSIHVSAYAANCKYDPNFLGISIKDSLFPIFLIIHLLFPPWVPQQKKNQSGQNQFHLEEFRLF